MRPPRRDPLPAADDGPSAAGFSRGIAAPPDRPRHFSRRAENGMRSPLAESPRDTLIEAMLPDVPFDGWSRAALRAAARRIGVPAAEALALFPDGPADFAACFSRWADRRMLDPLETLSLSARWESERVALSWRMRLALVEPWRAAV